MRDLPDEDDHVEVVLSGGPETELCAPPESMPASRPLLGFTPYRPRHRA